MENNSADSENPQDRPTPSPEVEASPAEIQPASPAPGGIRRDALVLIVVVIAVSSMITSAVYWSRKHNSVPQAASTGSAALQGDVNGKPAPDFTLKTVDGADVRLSDFKGKAVLLNFWATYCQPCKIEMPWFEELSKQYGPQGLAIVGVAMDDVGPDALKKFAKDVGVDYPILIGKESVADQYGGMEFLPTTFYIDRSGKIVERVFGLTSHSDIENNIKRALGSTTAQAQPAGK